MEYIETHTSYEASDRVWRGALPLQAVLFNPLSTLYFPDISRANPWLGAYEILRQHRGLPTTTPERLRSARIEEFIADMTKGESRRFVRWANWDDPTLIYAYELARDHPEKWTTQRPAR
jgi:hypothetical protein